MSDAIFRHILQKLFFFFKKNSLERQKGSDQGGGFYNFHTINFDIGYLLYDPCMTHLIEPWGYLPKRRALALVTAISSFLCFFVVYTQVLHSELLLFDLEVKLNNVKISDIQIQIDILVTMTEWETFQNRRRHVIGKLHPGRGPLVHVKAIDNLQWRRRR